MITFVSARIFLYAALFIQSYYLLLLVVLQKFKDASMKLWEILFFFSGEDDNMTRTRLSSAGNNTYLRVR